MIIDNRGFGVLGEKQPILRPFTIHVLRNGSLHIFLNEQTLGECGNVDKLLREGTCSVRFDDGQRFAYNEEVLTIVVDEGTMDPHSSGMPLR